MVEGRLRRILEARTRDFGCPYEGHLNSGGSGSCSEEVSSELNPEAG